jgi:hypothetical protein
MQKIELFGILQRISVALRSPQLYALTATDVEEMRTGNHAWSNESILPLLIDSKSQYDVLTADPVVRRVLEIMDAPRIYATKSFATLLQQVAVARNFFDVYHHKLFEVYEIHSAVQRQLKIFTELLVPDPTLLDSASGEGGVIVFECTDPDDSLDLRKLSKIIELISDLCRLVQLALKPQVDPISPRVVLLDSGSSTAVAIKTTAEAAASLFQVFKEMWDWLVNREHYKNRVQAETVNANLSLLERIQTAGASGTLSPERVREYSELIERRTDDLIGLGVLPKSLAAEVTSYSNSALLLNIGATKKLEEGERGGSEPAAAG